ncbi:hypothetical protein MIR68_007855 [Amoeboaphelidium protococcarum]|nr:hypothetical protein MIR68_007855 [Amoeboaphelidium protococcarum]
MSQSHSEDWKTIFQRRLDALAEENADLKLENAKLRKENDQLRKENDQWKKENDQKIAKLTAENEDLRKKVDKIAEDVKDIKSRMRDSRLAIAKSTASHDLALKMILILKCVSGVSAVLFVIALAFQLSRAVVWPPLHQFWLAVSHQPSLLGLFWMAQIHINEHIANIYNEKELQRSYDDLSKSKKND